MKKSILVLSTLTMVAFTSCNALKSTSSKTEKITSTELSNQLEGTWKLTFLDAKLSGAEGKSLSEMFPMKTPELTFDITKNYANGNNGCNNVFGPYFLSADNGISFGDKWASTMMACNGVSDYAFSNALAQISKFDIKEGELNLYINKKLVMTFTKQESVANVNLDGTQWVLDFVQPLDRSAKRINERFPQGLPTLAFNGSEFSGKTGCNNLSGGFELSGNAIKFGNAAMTRMYCAEVEENLFVGNLNAATKVKIENDQLVLSNDNDMVLLRFKKN